MSLPTTGLGLANLGLLLGQHHKHQGPQNGLLRPGEDGDEAESLGSPGATGRERILGRLEPRAHSIFSDLHFIASVIPLHLILNAIGHKNEPLSWFT